MMAPHNQSGGSDSDESSNHQVVPNSNRKRSKRNKVNKESDEYRRRRERNNLAVKKSRTKSKQKTMETLQRVSQLRSENEMLESKIKLLTKELSFLKDLFLAHAGSAHGQQLTDLDLTMLSEESATPESASSNVTALLPGTARSRSNSSGRDHAYAVKVERTYSQL